MHCSVQQWCFCSLVSRGGIALLQGSLFSASTDLPSGLQIKTKYYSLLVRGAVISPLHSRYNPVHKFIVSRLNLVKTDYEYNKQNRDWAREARSDYNTVPGV